MMIWRGSGGGHGGGVDDDMEGEWWIWRGSGDDMEMGSGGYGGGVVDMEGE